MSDDDSDGRAMLSFALDIVEAVDAILIFPQRVGPIVKFGYHRGEWCLVYNLSNGFTATDVERSAVADALEEDMEDVEIQMGRTDPAWHWLTEGGYDEMEMYRSHCMCGEWKYSTNVNHVQRWVESHKSDCYHDPKLQFEWNE